MSDHLRAENYRQKWKETGAAVEAERERADRAERLVAVAAAAGPTVEELRLGERLRGAERLLALVTSHFTPAGVFEECEHPVLADVLEARFFLADRLPDLASGSEGET